MPYALPTTPDPHNAALHGTSAEPALSGSTHGYFDHHAPAQSVWHEPAAADHAAAPAERPYALYLREGIARTSLQKSWAITLLLSLSAGPWAILGAFWNMGATPFQILALVLFAPLIEEVMKVGLPAVLLERRPFLFRDGRQILLCAFLGGLSFSIIENLLYLFVYFPDARPRCGRGAGRSASRCTPDVPPSRAWGCFACTDRPCAIANPRRLKGRCPCSSPRPPSTAATTPSPSFLIDG